MAPITEHELNEAIREVLKRSVVDPDFRTKAIGNGSAAITEVSGKSLSSGTTITFVSNSDKDEKVVILPDPVTDANLLSDAELEQIAGGLERDCTATSCAVSG
jgi:hypothetical protein